MAQNYHHLFRKIKPKNLPAPQRCRVGSPQLIASKQLKNLRNQQDDGKGHLDDHPINPIKVPSCSGHNSTTRPISKFFQSLGHPQNFPHVFTDQRLPAKRPYWWPQLLAPSPCIHGPKLEGPSEKHPFFFRRWGYHTISLSSAIFRYKLVEKIPELTNRDPQWPTSGTSDTKKKKVRRSWFTNHGWHSLAKVLLPKVVPRSNPWRPVSLGPPALRMEIETWNHQAENWLSQSM